MRHPATPTGHKKVNAINSNDQADKATVGKETGFQGVARQTVWYGVGMLLAKGLSVVMLPVYTRFLTPADYGVLALITMTLDVVMIVAGGQLVAGIFRFYHKADDVAEQNRVVSTSFVLLAASFGSVGVLAVFAAPQLSEFIFESRDHVLLFRIAAATVAVTPTITVPQAYFRVRNEAGLFVLSNLVMVLLGAVLNVVLLLAGWGILAMLASGLVTTSAVGVGLTLRMLRQSGVTPSGAVARNLIRYGVPLVITNIATFIITFGDRFFLQRAGDESVVGIYMMAYQFGLLLMAVGSGPFMQVWGPRRFEIAEHDNRDELYSKGFLYLNVMLLTVATAMALFIDDFFRIMTTPAFHSAGQYVPVILAAYVLQAWTGVQEIGILVKERTEYIAIANWVAAGVAVIGYAFLVPKYLAWGAAWTTFLAMAVRYGIIYFKSQSIWPLHYEWVPVLKLTASASAAVALGEVLPPLALFQSLAVRTLLLFAFVFTMARWEIVSHDDRTALIARGRSVLTAIKATFSTRP